MLPGAEASLNANAAYSNDQSENKSQSLETNRDKITIELIGTKSSSQVSGSLYYIFYAKKDKSEETLVKK